MNVTESNRYKSLVVASRMDVVDFAFMLRYFEAKGISPKTKSDVIGLSLQLLRSILAPRQEIVSPTLDEAILLASTLNAKVSRKEILEQLADSVNYSFIEEEEQPSIELSEKMKKLLKSE